MQIVRYLILMPLGILLGATAAMLTLLMLTIFVPELAQTIGSAAYAAVDALFDALTQEDTLRAATIGWKAWQLLLLIIVMPVVLTAVSGEFFRMGALAHGVISGLLAALVPLAAKMPASTAESRVLACLFFAGAAGGLLYYLIGGRRAVTPAPQALPLR